MEETKKEELAREVKKNDPQLADRLNNVENTRTPKESIESITESSDESCHAVKDTSTSPGSFKKPIVLVGSKRSRSTGKPIHLKTYDATHTNNQNQPESTDVETNNSTSQSTERCNQTRDISFSYNEPSWGGQPPMEYKLEVLKSGVIMDTIPLHTQSFYVIGRVPSCHLSMAHPTISRHHAVLQYRTKEDKDNSKGFYVYDLGSTHGTFWNGNRIKPNVYVRVQGGHMLRFGCSQRKYILQAPPDDQEEESEYSVSQLKERRAVELEKRRADEETRATLEEKESEGIDWGMGEDADEATDLEENPYACITDEDLVLDDPKKTLRGWFEREGYDLQYQTEEKGIGQFLCWVDLPIENVAGRSVRAEALVKGKKKEAVVQCALEACRILDKYGLLRQANHEARKRKTRNWEEEDYYDSDEDNFLDRTGSIEKKREQRMRQAGKFEEKVETYDSLLKKHEEVEKRISSLSNSIENWEKTSNETKETMEVDALDAFMSTLNASSLTKNEIVKMKVELQNLRKEESGLLKLLNLTRPADLPALTSKYPLTTEDKTNDQSNQLKTKKLRTVGSTQSRLKPSLSSSSSASSTLSNQIKITDDTKGECQAEDEVEEEDEEEDEDADENKKINEDVREGQGEDGDKTDNNIEDKSKPLNRVDKTTESSTNRSKTLYETKVKERKSETKSVKESAKKVAGKLGQTSCDEDVYSDNYSMWLPPQDQAGDGKTSLNEKYGY